MCEWKTETKFLRFYLPCLVQAADVELVGEFIQALRCVGVSELEHDMLTASTFLLNSRNTNTVRSKQFYVYKFLTHFREAGSTKVQHLKHNITPLSAVLVSHAFIPSRAPMLTVCRGLDETQLSLMVPTCRPGEVC